MFPLTIKYQLIKTASVIAHRIRRVLVVNIQWRASHGSSHELYTFVVTVYAVCQCHLLWHCYILCAKQLFGVIRHCSLFVHRWDGLWAPIELKSTCLNGYFFDWNFWIYRLEVENRSGFEMTRKIFAFFTGNFHIVRNGIDVVASIRLKMYWLSIGFHYSNTSLRKRSICIV